MIVVTIGTNEQPFDRLVRAVSELETSEPLFVQYGSSTITSGPGDWKAFLGFDELAGRMREARVVICHAGVGSIMLARQCKRRPIVVPRRVDRSEAVDDHQLLLAQRLHASGLVTLVEDESELATVISTVNGDATSFGAGDMPGAGALAASVSACLDRLGAPPNLAADPGTGGA